MGFNLVFKGLNALFAECSFNLVYFELARAHFSRTVQRPARQCYAATLTWREEKDSPARINKVSTIVAEKQSYWCTSYGGGKRDGGGVLVADRLPALRRGRIAWLEVVAAPDVGAVDLHALWDRWFNPLKTKLSRIINFTLKQGR